MAPDIGVVGVIAAHLLCLGQIPEAILQMLGLMMGVRTFVCEVYWDFGYRYHLLVSAQSESYEKR